MKKKLVFSKRRPKTLMKFTKIKGLVLFPVLAMLLAGCGGNQPAPQKKKDVSITIALEDGKQFNENEFVAPAVSVDPSSITPTITYFSGELQLDAAPQTVGDYKITVTTAETKEYYAGLASKSFLIRKVPTLTFYYGEDVLLDEGHQFLQGEAYNIYAKSSVEGAQITYSYTTQDGTAVNGKPTEVGVYYCYANVARTSVIGSKEQSIRFEIVEKEIPDATIKFFYGTEEKCLDGANWLNGSYGNSQYYAADFDITKLTYTVEPSEATFSEEWSFKALDAPEEASGEVIAKPSNPLNPGIYTVTITVAESEVCHGKFRWAGFVIKEPKPDPVIKFFYGEEEKCLDGANWLNGGYGNSQFYAEDFDITKFSYTINPSTLTYTEQWAFKTLDAPEEAAATPIAKPSNPLDSGIYTITLNVTGNEQYNSMIRWAGFVIKDGSKPESVIKFFYGTEEKCLDGANWLNGGYGNSQYYAAEFDITKLTYTVEPSTASKTETWTFKELTAPEEDPATEIAKPSNPLNPGIYTLTIAVEASETHAAKIKWAGFVIKEPKPDPVIKFFYGEEEKCLDGANWLNGGYGNSQYYATEFDVTKLTYTVDPSTASKTETWTFKELTAPEEDPATEIAKPSGTLNPGIYTVTITVTGSDVCNAGFRWAGFVIKAPK